MHSKGLINNARKNVTWRLALYLDQFFPQTSYTLHILVFFSFLDNNPLLHSCVITNSINDTLSNTLQFPVFKHIRNILHVSGWTHFQKKKRFGIIVPAGVTRRSPGTRRASFAGNLKLRLVHRLGWKSCATLLVR